MFSLTYNIVRTRRRFFGSRWSIERVLTINGVPTPRLIVGGLRSKAEAEHIAMELVAVACEAHHSGFLDGKQEATHPAAEGSD